MPADLDLAYDHCQRVAKEHARNFYYAFRTLPARKRNAIYAAYAFCRLCDDIADGELPLEHKRRLFAETRDRLTKPSGDSGRDPVFRALADVSEVFNIPDEYLEEIIQGVEMDLALTRFQTFEELRTYCYKVASVVGLLCIEVFGYEDPKAKEHAVDLGLAMQLTNILRDVREDAERGRIYIPMEDLERFGYTERELFDGVVNDAFRDLMRFQAARARGFFDSGKLLIPLLSAESRSCPAVLHGVYSAILDRIEAEGFNVFERRIGLTKTRKLIITARLWAKSLIPAVPHLGR